MRNRYLFLVSILYLALLIPALGSEFKPIVIVFDGKMPAFAEGVAKILQTSSTGGEDFVALADPILVSSMLALPNIRCLILTSVSSTDLQTLIKPVIGYFESGGSAIGFHGSCWQSHLGDMARIVFPAYGNSTGVGARKGSLSVNEYVKEESLAGIGEQLPDSFDLVGQFFAVAKDQEKNVVSPTPLKGRKTILYKDKKSGAPLVIAYEGESGGRTISFTGFFLRDNPNAANHYEKLLKQTEFQTLLADCYRWTAEGNDRFNSYKENYEQVIEDRRQAEEDLARKSEEREASRKGRKALMLAVFWALGIACIIGLSYWGFIRPSKGE